MLGIAFKESKDELHRAVIYDRTVQFIFACQQVYTCWHRRCGKIFTTAAAQFTLIGLRRNLR
jgi:hypothetical protein